MVEKVLKNSFLILYMQMLNQLKIQKPPLWWLLYFKILSIMARCRVLNNLFQLY